jgi:Cation/multidrug efflux pump
MIPISFVGAFLAFGWSKVSFDQGGFAAFVMLSGLVVNAAIYLISDWRKELDQENYSGRCTSSCKSYMKAFSHKIWPITLTVISTVLGLVPFLLDGPQDVFWFDFALGTIAGLVFSCTAIVLYLPVLLLPRSEKTKNTALPN